MVSSSVIEKKKHGGRSKVPEGDRSSTGTAANYYMNEVISYLLGASMLDPLDISGHKTWCVQRVKHDLGPPCPVREHLECTIPSMNQNGSV